MTLLKFVNYFFFQFFFIRLAKVVDSDTQEFIEWSWITKVVPFTGWRKPYKYINQ